MGETEGNNHIHIQKSLESIIWFARKKKSYGLRLCKIAVGKMFIIKTTEENASPITWEEERRQQEKLSQHQLCGDVCVRTILLVCLRASESVKDTVRV